MFRTWGVRLVLIFRRFFLGLFLICYGGFKVGVEVRFCFFLLVGIWLRGGVCRVGVEFGSLW